MHRVRRGMTIAEVLVVLAILVVLSAIVVPQLTNRLQSGQSAALAEQLTGLRTAIVNYRDNVNRYPTSLTQLTTPITGADQDICGAVIPAAFVSRWRGPYLMQAVPTTGIPIGDFLVETDVVRNPLTDAATAPGALQINVQNVPIATAAELEKQFDGDSVYTTGTIQWNSGTLRLTFQVLIRNC